MYQQGTCRCGQQTAIMVFIFIKGLVPSVFIMKYQYVWTE
jgi:hypothetical protein